MTDDAPRRQAERPASRETGEPERLDAPNQQVVRPDASGPADEGSGGSGGKPKRGRPPAAAGRPAAKAQDDPPEPPKAQKGG